MLSYFVAVAKQRSFTKAAELCFISQPALSRAIQELEEELGCQLFERTSRKVDLTAEGRVCLDEAQALLSRADGLAERVQAARRSEFAPIRVGYIIYSQIEVMLKRYSELLFELDLHLETIYDDPPVLMDRFERGDLDMMVIPSPYIAGKTEITSSVIMKGCYHALLGLSHRFAGRAFIEPAELKDENLVFWDYDLLRPAYDNTLEMCRAGGFVPNIVATARKLGDMTAQVVMKSAIGLTHWFNAPLITESVTSVPIANTEAFSELMIAWRPKNVSPAVSLLIDNL